MENGAGTYTPTGALSHFLPSSSFLQGRFCCDSTTEKGYTLSGAFAPLFIKYYTVLPQICKAFPKSDAGKARNGPPQGTARSAILQKAYSWVFFRFSPMLNSRLRAMPKMAAPAMQGTCRPKKGMLPPN